MASKRKKKVNFHDQLIDLLGQVDRPGKICCGGDRPLTLPGLQVDGLGTVGLPLVEAQAAQLIELCHQAPYGKGAKTLVDTKVRRAWELDATQFQLTNPKWKQLLAEIVANVQHQLGLVDCKLRPHLYNLLVYEPGGFFVPHRDGEKLDAMVATLVICLPSVHRGGELLVSHRGQQHSLSMAGAASGYELSYAAFYADCEHEVRAVRSGYRLCLTYNLTLAGSRKKQGIAAPDYRSATMAIGTLLTDWSRRVCKAWSSSMDLPGKLALTLDHQYSQDGLVFSRLKGIDRARAEVVFDAANQAGCIAHLGLITHWQSGSVDYDQQWHGRYGRYDRDQEEPEPGEYQMGEIIDDSLSIDHWSDRAGSRVSFGEIGLQEKEIISETPLDEWESSDEEYEGYTGNAGMTLERWYHRAAIVVWPRERHFEVLCAAGKDAAIGGLEPMVQRLKTMAPAKGEKMRQQCLSFAAAIIDLWNTNDTRYWGQPEHGRRGILPQLLLELDDPELVQRFLEQVMAVDGQMKFDRSLVKFCTRHGWPRFATSLSTVINASAATTIGRNAELLKLIGQHRDKKVERISLCQQLADQFVSVLILYDDHEQAPQWQCEKLDRSALLVALVELTLAVEAEQSLSRLIDQVLDRSDKYDLTKVQLPAIFALNARLTKRRELNGAIARWLGESRRALETCTQHAPEQPKDYRRANKPSCKCELCRDLSAFLDDPDQKILRIPTATNNRHHLHQSIDSSHCDLTHVTERKGRPYTLVCTKTTASYQAACQIYNRDLENLKRVLVLGGKIGCWES